MNTLPDEIVRKIADMKIAADYCSLTVYDDWGVLFWIARCVTADPWLCRMSFPNTETQKFLRKCAEPGTTLVMGTDMLVQWTPVLTLRTKDAVETLVTNVFTERIGYADGGYDDPLEIVKYYYSQDGGGVPPKYQARSVINPWQDYDSKQDIAPDAIGGHCRILDYQIRDHDTMDAKEATPIRIKIIMKAIQSLVATM
jgi:hypothetical protein